VWDVTCLCRKPWRRWFASAIRSAAEVIAASCATKLLRDQSTPILFVQGTRDLLFPLEVLAGVRGEMHAVNELHVVEGGDHSLRVTKSYLKASGETQDNVDRHILEVIQKFVTKHSETVG
jgi:predicted alpha/beta-hydrolase family hydrolase